MTFDVQRLLAYPEKPGVYLMKDDKGLILYIGKAKNLKARLKQYFLPGRDERVQIPFLIASVQDIETIIVETEKEALLLEARLIRRFKPKYNVLLKDDRSHLLIRLSLEHECPRIEYVRSKNMQALGPRAFGPFSRTRDMFELAVRLFQIRQCSDEEFKRRKAPCILHQMKRCSAPCVKKVDQQEYQIQIQQASDFLSGKMSWVREQLYRQMMEASEKLEFEKAGMLHSRIQLLDELAAQQEGGRIEGIQSCDAVGVWQEGQKGFAITLMHYRYGFLSFSEGWVFDQEADKSVRDLSELIASCIVQLYQFRYDAHSSQFHDDEEGLKELLLPSEYEDSALVIEDALSDIFHRKISVKCPRIGPKAKITRLAAENAKARLWQKSNAKELASEILAEMASELGLKRFPQSIDCFDASHFGGKQLVASCISFEGGLPNKKRYRTFNAKLTTTADDVGMIQEAIYRRYKGESDAVALPDLIIVDGGKTQLKAAQEALERLQITDRDLIAVTKEAGRHDKGMTNERCFLPGRAEPVQLNPRSSTLLLLQRIRDEAHRFSIGFQKKQRSKAMFKSQLDDIPGIGLKKRQKILTAFSGIKAILEASVDEISKKAGVSLQDAERVKKALNE